MATPHQLEEARRRQALVDALPRYASLKAAAEGLGEPIANLSRYRKAYQAGGGSLESLIPKTDNAGRPPLAVILTDDEIAFAKRYQLELESLPLAIEYLADSPVCSHRTRELLNRYRDSRDYPPSLYQALRLPEEVWAAYRGKKQAQGTTFVTRRGMFMLDAQGQRREIVSGDIIEEDDVSVDVPYFVTLPDGTFRVGRQVLMARDVRSGAFRGAVAVARERDSYRAEDIVRFNKWLIESHGLPGRFRFERGKWESDAIRGLELPDGRRWGGLAQLVPVDPQYSSNGKGGIESSFRMWHKLLGLYGVRIGKTRGEYEQPSADMMAVNDGKKHPRECGFIPWEDVLHAFNEAGKKYNGRAHYDRHSGETLAPDDIWWRDMQARQGKRLPVCPPEYGFHFLPVKRIVGVGTTQAGHVSVSVEGYRQPFMFQCAGIGPDGREFPFLERKHRVIVCFDPHEAAAGAQIFNLDDTARNRGGFRLLEKLFTAPLAVDRPQFDLSGRARAEDPTVQARKIRDQQVRASFTSLGVFGKGARRVQHSHDGDGRTARVESGAAPLSRMESPAAPAPAPKPARRAAPAIAEDFTTETPAALPAALVHRSAAPASSSAARLSALSPQLSAFEDWA